MYAVCVYWPFHLEQRTGLIISGLVFLFAFVSSLLKRKQAD